METHYADTTVVYYKLHGHTLQKNAVRETVANGTLAVSNFVRGEYIRGYVTGLIELYYAIKAENSLSDGILYFNSKMGNRHPRKVANAFHSTITWLRGLEDPDNVEKTMRRLGEQIRNILMHFDNTFVHRVRDPLACEIGVLSFPSDTYQEQHILDFYEEFNRIRDNPGCDQCDFRRDQEAKLSAVGIDLGSDAQQEKFSKHEGYIKQAKSVRMARRSSKTQPSCWYCDRLGDTIIALSIPNGMTILTGDAQSFRALAQILGKPLALIPSLESLRQNRPPGSSPSSRL